MYPMMICGSMNSNQCESSRTICRGLDESGPGANSMQNLIEAGPKAHDAQPDNASPTSTTQVIARQAGWRLSGGSC